MAGLPRRPWEDHSITARVLVLQGTSWLVGVLLVGVVAWSALEASRQDVAYGRRAVATLVARQVDRTLADDLTALQQLSGAPATALDAASTRAAIRDAFVRSTLWDGLQVLDGDGAMRVREPVAMAPVAAASAAVADVMRTGRPTFAAGTDGAHLLVLVPLRKADGGPAGVAVGVIDLPSPALTRVLEASGGDPHQAVRLLDAAGRALASSGVVGRDEDEAHAAALGARVAARAPWAGTLDAPVETDVVLEPLAMAPWAVVVSHPSAAAGLASGSVARLLLWLAPLGLLLGGLFAWGTARSVRQPVEALSRAAERMADGDLTTPLPSLPGDEIGRLGRVLEHVRQALSESVEAIAGANERLEQQVRDRTRELEQLCDRLENRDRWRGEVLRRVISAQEDERRRLARELHDDICQALAALSVALGAALDGVSAPAARQRLASVGALVDRSLADLHRMIYDLRPSILDDLGLVPAIRWLAQEHIARHGTGVRCEFAELDRRLAPEVETGVFRVVQEALMNIERHARADSVLVQAALDGPLLAVEVEDDGQGFDPAAVGAPTAQGRGLGLLGMRERVELLGGSLLVESTPGQGTRIVLSVPAGEPPVERAPVAQGMSA